MCLAGLRLKAASGLGFLPSAPPRLPPCGRGGQRLNVGTRFFGCLKACDIIGCLAIDAVASGPAPPHPLWSVLSSIRRVAETSIQVRATLEGGITVTKVYQKRTPTDVLLYLKDLHNKFHKLGSSTSFVERYKQIGTIEAGFKKWAEDNNIGAGDDSDSDDESDDEPPAAKRQNTDGLVGPAGKAGGGMADKSAKGRDLVVGVCFHRCNAIGKGTQKALPCHVHAESRPTQHTRTVPTESSSARTSRRSFRASGSSSGHGTSGTRWLARACRRSGCAT